MKYLCHMYIKLAKLQTIAIKNTPLSYRSQPQQLTQHCALNPAALWWAPVRDFLLSLLS